ncbi:MAG TPA: IS200/IS605 family transposase [Chitinophagaceae bacterium]|nr:IS200/IS605 family transposase [Chitinophagaceae bacterium]
MGNDKILQNHFNGFINYMIMPHSFNKIWIHAIWATKERYPLIHPPVEKKIYGYMTTELIGSGCPVRVVNGMPDHVHCLFLLNPQKSIAEIIKQVKGSTSHWVNEQDLIKEKFSWQTGYAAYSVSESVLEKVFQYISSQKQHHQKTTFLQEYNEFIKLHGLQND